MRTLMWLLAILLLSNEGCPSNTGAGDGDARYCASSDDVEYGDQGSEQSVGWECDDAPMAEILYTPAQIGIGTDLLPGTGSLTADDQALYLSIKSSRSAFGTFRLEKDGSRITKLSDEVLEDLVFSDGKLYGVSDGAVSGSVIRIDPSSGDAQRVGAEGGVDGLKRSPDGRFFTIQKECPWSSGPSTIAAFDPQSGTSTPLITDACITEFTVATNYIAWTERAEGDRQESVHVAGIDGHDRRLLTDPPGDPLVSGLQIAHGYVYFDVDPAFPDADVVRVPITGGETKCVAHAALSTGAVDGGTFFSLDSPDGPPGCLVRYDGVDEAAAVAQIKENAINSELVIDGDFAYAVSLTWDGPTVIRIPVR